MHFNSITFVIKNYYYYYVFILSAISSYTTELKALFNQSDCTGTAPQNGQSLLIVIFFVNYCCQNVTRKAPRKCQPLPSSLLSLIFLLLDYIRYFAGILIQLRHIVYTVVRVSCNFLPGNLIMNYGIVYTYTRNGPISQRQQIIPKIGSR